MQNLNQWFTVPAVSKLFVYWKPQTGTWANSKDLDEMQHNAAFHHGLHCLLRLKEP